MCGFAGFFGGDIADRRGTAEKMGERIAHRGPDDSGRRLSIIDLDRGVQPMKSEDDRYVIVFNGEIYNFKELRAELERRGVSFSTSSDTEVILKSYMTYGKDAVPMLRGMFAFVIYDRQEGKLFGARDWFGIKPFYYTEVGGAFLFGSEIKSS